MVKISRLPAVVDALFLAQRGQLGVRCPCGFVVTGWSLQSVNEGIAAHMRYLHLPAEEDLRHNAAADIDD